MAGRSTLRRSSLRRSLVGLALAPFLGLARLPDASAAEDIWARGVPSIRTFGEVDGIPQSSVNTIALEPGGRLWIGTQVGPASYDSKGFTPLSLPTGGAPSWVWSIAVAHDGAVWFGMDSGDVFRHADGAVRRFSVAEGLGAVPIRSLAETHTGGKYALWAGTQKGLFRLEGERWARVELGSPFDQKLVRTLLEGRLPSGEPTLWVGSHAGLLHCEDERCAPFATSANGLPGDAVNALLESKDDRGQHVLWAGTKNGLGRYADGQWEHFTTANSPLPEDAVQALAETVSGSGRRALWIGTYGGGVSRLEGGRWTTLSTKSSELPDEFIRALVPSGGAHGGRTLWIGTESSGLARLRHDGWSAFTQRNAPLPSAVFAITEMPAEDGTPELWMSADAKLARFSEKAWSTIDLPVDTDAESLVMGLVPSAREPGVLWIGTSGGGLWRRGQDGRITQFTANNSPLPHVVVQELRASLDGRALLVSTYGGAARFVTPVGRDEAGEWQVFTKEKTPLLDDDVRVTLETARPGREPTLWFGTARGLSRLEDGQWQSHTSANTPLGRDYVSALAELRDARGARVLWVGTFGGGVARYDLDRGAWRETLTDRTSTALPDTTVNQIREDARGRIYLFTNHGIARLTPRAPTPDDPAEFSVYTFTIEDGLPSNECNQNASFVDSRGRLWAGTTAGAAVFDPAEEVSDLAPKPLVISAARIHGAGRALSPGEALAWDQNTVSFDYALLGFFRERDTRYRAQLVGFDAAPSEWAADEKARYTNLPAGAYAFRVWGRDYAGNIAGPVEMAFHVKPAPWRAWWAYFGYAAVATGLVYGGLRFRVRALARRNRALEKRVAERTAQLDRKLEELAQKNRELEESHRRADRIFSALADVLPGTVLDDKYRLESKIGAGGFGMIFRATHTGLGRTVAVKIFRPSPGNDSAVALERFLKEGASACRVAHPNAMQVFDSGISREGIAYLVMELLEGHSLADELAPGGALPLRRAARILAETSGALEAAHATGLLHRDIKPENVFLHRAPEGEMVKVVDFGLAKLMGPDADQKNVTMLDALTGTPVYMAPERFRGEPYDARSDVYSVGVTLYEMVSGKLPYPLLEGSIVQIVMQKHTRPPLDLREAAPWVPAEAARIVMRCLSTNPAERPGLGELVRVFGDAVAALPDEAQDEAHGTDRAGVDRHAQTIDGEASLGG